VIEITGWNVPGAEVYANLTGAELENRKGLFIAEGLKVAGHALDAGCEPISLLMERKHITGKAAGLIERCGDIPVYTGDSALLATLTGFPLTRGVLCAMRRPEIPSAEKICTGARRIAVLENIGDASNVGAIFRSAAALGMDAVLVTPGCCDPLNRRAVRVSMGTVFQVPWAYIGETPADWPDAMERIRKMGFRTVAAALRENARTVDDPELKSAEKLAVVLGAEGDGLTNETIAACDESVIIPMRRGVDSLNVAAAASVLFWELGKPSPG